MENSYKGLFMAAGAVFFAAALSFLFMCAGGTRDMSGSLAKNMSDREEILVIRD